MPPSSSLLPALVLLSGLAACSGGETTTPPEPVPAAAPAPEPEPDAQDTATPGEPAVDQEALQRKEFFEHIDEKGEAPPVEPAVATAPAPARPTPAPAPVKPAPAPAAPAPRPVATAPRPAPVPLPKPVTSLDAAASAAPAPAPAATAVRPAPRPAPAPQTGDAVADAATPAPRPPVGGTSEAIPLSPQEDPVERCGDPSDLEEAASKGALSNADLACLDEAYAATSATLGRERVSVLMLSNAFAAGDRVAQEDLLSRHLSEVDPDNPEMAYRYALLLMKGGTGNARSVVRWSNVGLTNRAAWTGETYRRRVYSLYKLRAAASQQELTDAQAAYSELPGTDTERALYRAREDTKRYAREWYLYARQTDQDAQAALDLCLVAAQNSTWCMQGSFSATPRQGSADSGALVGSASP